MMSSWVFGFTLVAFVRSHGSAIERSGTRPADTATNSPRCFAPSIAVSHCSASRFVVKPRFFVWPPSGFR
ncbi:hypothetical protein NLU66_16770 [Brachybacterium sp. NBEC-018]|nr:hypothetical protein [Brachybacterium sp. NBEC-018]UVY83842.1 hypothetical protein NLU66_16770 [Brachybacterium sp. NBEC-018]